MKGGYWMIRTIKSGKVIEKSQFPVGERRPRKPRRKGSSSAAKRDSNLRSSERRLAQALNCNFEEGDLLLTLTYSDEALEQVGADGQDKACSLFARKLTRILGKIGIKLRGIWMTADKDSESLDPVRVHHHLVVKREGWEICRDRSGKIVDTKVGGRSLSSLWSYGIASVEPLKDQDDYTPLAVYLVRQAKSGADEKKWHSTRNLAKPIVKSEIVAARVRELRAPGGADVKEVGRYDVETGSHYLRYILPDRSSERKIHAIRAEIDKLEDDLALVGSQLARSTLEQAIRKKQQELRALGAC